MGFARQVFEVIKKTFSEFARDDCPRMAAAMAYYTIFSMPALLVLILFVTGFVTVGAQERLTAEISEMIGGDAARQTEQMITSARNRLSSQGGWLPMAFGAAALIFGATGAFAQLQAALNRVWEVRPDPKRGGIKNFVTKRLLSFGMVLLAGLLLLALLILSTALGALGSEVQGFLPPGVSAATLRAADMLLSFSILTVLFAAIYRILPDARVEWREVGVGAAVTALLFVIGKSLIGLYIGRSDPASAFGAAGSLAVLLIWIYMSALILFLGAEFTQVWARRHGKPIEPSKGAVHVIFEIRRDEEGTGEEQADAESADEPGDKTSEPSPDETAEQKTHSSGSERKRRQDTEGLRTSPRHNH